MQPGKRIQKTRTESGLTRDHLAKRLGLSYWAVAKYETGERVPPQDILVAMASILDVSTDYLLGLTDDRRPMRTNLPPYVDQLSPDLQAFLRKEAAAGWPRIKLLYDADLAGLTPRQLEQVLSVLVDVKKREEQAKE